MSGFDGLNDNLGEQNETSDKTCDFEVHEGRGTDVTITNLDSYDTAEILSIEHGGADVNLETNILPSDVGIDFKTRSLDSVEQFEIDCHDTYNLETNEAIQCYKSNTLFNANKSLDKSQWVCHAKEKQGTTTVEDQTDNQKKADIQSKPKIWKCKYGCGKIFTQEKYMNSHIQVMHENINMVQCKICSKFLSTELRLKSHMLRHSGVKHLVCLLCVKKRTNELSCMRHHLSERHGISSKHILFHETYYQLSLKEISLMVKYKNNQSDDETRRNRKGINSVHRKSAIDMSTLKEKIFEKSTKIQNDLRLFRKTTADIPRETESAEISCDEFPTVKSEISNFLQILTTKPQKIVTAENGMKLVKLPSGQFKKMNFP